jgi:hypothetical protein
MVTNKIKWRLEFHPFLRICINHFSYHIGKLGDSLFIFHFAIFVLLLIGGNVLLIVEKSGKS